ncbi:hypothetical protein D3C78_1335620 [compost metagenome]
MISAAMPNVPISVSISPTLSVISLLLGAASSIRPLKANNTPTQAITPGKRPNTNHCNSGTIGTYMAVMNADWLLLMVCNPTVCRP